MPTESVPVVPNPTVESTVIILLPIPTVWIAFDVGVIVKFPCIVGVESSYPRKSDIL